MKILSAICFTGAIIGLFWIAVNQGILFGIFAALVMLVILKMSN